MANKGLKNYTKQLTHMIGNAGKANINLNYNDANIIFVLPLIKTIGTSPIELSLIYNHQNRDENLLFGSGMRLNLYAKVLEIDGGYALHHADGSIDYFYEEEEYKNKETQSTLTKVIDDEEENIFHYELKDKYGNIRTWKNLNVEYASTIKAKNGDEVTIDFLSEDKKIYNNRGDTLIFNFVNRAIDFIKYQYNGTTLYTIEFILSRNSWIQTLNYYKGENEIINKTTLSFSTSQIIITDAILNYGVKYLLTNQRVQSFSSGYNNQWNNTTTITYETNKTRVKDYLNNESTIFFDKDDMPLYEIDSEGNVIKTKFDEETKELLSESGFIPVKNKYQNLLPGENINIFTASGITLSAVTCTDSFFSNILGNTIYKATGTGTLSYRINLNGIATDTITAVIWGKQLTPYSPTSNVKVYLYASGNDTETFEKEIVDNEFDLITLGLNCKKSYSYIELRFVFSGNASIELGGIQILKKNFGAFYEYDDSGNVTNLDRGINNVSLSYHTNNSVATSLGVDSTLYRYEYDDYGQMIKARTAYGVFIENEYDSQHHTNLLKRVVSNFDESAKLEIKNEYTEDGRFIASQTDELNHKTTYEYDSFGKLTQIVNALDATLEFEYYNDELLKIIKLSKGNQSTEVNYTYDSKKRISSILLKNGSLYQFEYDNHHNITKIKLNGTTLYTFTYDTQLDLITKQTFGETNEAIEFEYDETLLSKVYFIDKTGLKELKYTYHYDSLKQLEEIRNQDNQVLISVEYDNDGRIIQTNNDKFCFNYHYDNLGNVNQRKRLINDKQLFESFDSINRSKGSNPEALLAALQADEQWFGSLFVDGVYLQRKQTIIPPSYLHQYSAVNFELKREGAVPYIHISAGKQLSYAMNIDSYYPDESGCVAFWFKTSNINLTQYLFSSKSELGKDFISVYMDEGVLYVQVVETNGTWHTILQTSLDNLVQKNKWNFFGLNWMNRNDGLGYSDVCEYALTLNGKTVIYQKANPRLYVDLGPSYYNIGHFYNGSESYQALEADIACLIVGAKRYISQSEMQQFYQMTKDYLIENQFIEEEVKTVDFSLSQLYTYNQSILNLFEIYPLQNNVISLTGKKPIKFDIRQVTPYDKDRTFNFNKMIKRYAYVADGTLLKYNFGISNAGTIMMRAFTDIYFEKQYFFEGYDNNGNRIALFRGEDRELCIDFCGTIIYSKLFIEDNIWHTVGLSFEKTTVWSESLDTSICQIEFRFYLDGQIKELVHKESTDFSLQTFMWTIGRKEYLESSNYNLGTANNYCALHGQIEMLATRSAFCEKTTLDTLCEELKTFTKIKEYDELGLIKKVNLHKGGESVLSTTIDYLPRRLDENGQLPYSIQCNVISTEQLIEIPAGASFTFESCKAYAADSNGISYYELNPDRKLSNITWNANQEVIDTWSLQEQLQFYNANQAFAYFEDFTWKNETDNSFYILQLNRNLSNELEIKPFISTQVKQEKINTKNGLLTTRKYTTNKLGNVIKISDSVFGDCDYEYDYRGFLTKETGITYQYDDNGNILKVGNKTFEYDSAIKDRLIKANGQTLSYHPTGNLSTWKNWTYQFEGKYLKQINHNIFYEYDMLGLRISKTINNQKTTYLYDGNLLLTEITPTYRNDFLYDENGILYGFIHDYSTKYFYVRDVFQNILGIVDENGNLVVKYAYTAYGTLKSISGSLATTIGQYNPFRFKGYYYDQESELFYCNGRYYSSELCRFIQPADVSSLNLSSINGLNLYSYANNNPIGIAYSGFSVAGSSSGGMKSFTGGINSDFPNSMVSSNERIYLPAMPWLAENATTIYGVLSSISTGIPILSFYYKYASIINDEFRLYGISKWKTSQQLSNVNIKMGALDKALIGINVLMDMYDSYQHGVSNEGIILGGIFTATSSAGMFYLNKGIMWASTTIGTAICPGIGTAIGFTVGLVGSIFVDIFLGARLADWIDENIK